jgi:hypothetical protein
MGESSKLRRKRASRSISLDREQTVFAAKLGGWLSDHEGEYVLIKGDEVGGFYETREKALAAGYAQFGVGPLLVKQILRSEPVYHIPNAII